jgi:hypothetical protein
MPSVMDAPELIEHIEIHDLPIETTARPQPHRARPRFWRTLVHKIAGYFTPTPPAWHEGVCHVSHPYEAPMDRFVREYPYLAVYALALI